MSNQNSYKDSNSITKKISDYDQDSSNRKSSFKQYNNKKSNAKSFSEKKKLNKRSMFQMAYEDQVIMEHEIQDTKKNLKSFADQMEELDPAEADQIIDERKKSVVAERKSTNLQVVLAITNTMVGSVALCLPYTWLQGGFISSLVIMLLMGIIQYLTCTVVVQVQRKGDTDLAQIVERILNKKWATIFGISSSMLLFFAGIVYFMLQNQVLYAFSKFILYYAKGEAYVLSLPDISTVDFDSFSVQYQCIVLAVPIFFLISMKELSIIIKMGQFGVLAILCYGIFIIYLFIQSLADTNFSFNWQNYMSLLPEGGFQGVISVTGNFSLAFFLHNGITTILANSEHLNQKVKNTFYGYLNVVIIYGMVGILGSIGLLNNALIQNPQEGMAVQTIMQLFPPQQVFPAIVNLLFLFQLSTALPILCFISRSQFYAMIFGQNKIYPQKYNLIFNLVFMGSCVTLQVLSVDPSLLIGIDGAICGFYMVYLLPFFVRMKSYGKIEELTQDPVLLLSSSTIEDQNQNVTKRNQVNQVNGQDSTLDSNYQTQLLESEYNENNDQSFNKNEELPFVKLPVYEYIAWGFALLVGVGLGGLQLYGIFAPTTDNNDE